MAIIYLTKNFETIVDDELYEDLNQYNWYASGYSPRPARRLRVGPRKVICIYHQILHVLPWVLNSMNLVVDHIDRNPLNNQLSNLRITSQKVNMRNTDRHVFRIGVCFDNTWKKYKAYIDQPDIPRINVGTYKTEEEAYTALELAKRELGLCV